MTAVAAAEGMEAMAMEEDVEVQLRADLEPFRAGLVAAGIMLRELTDSVRRAMAVAAVIMEAHRVVYERRNRLDRSDYQRRLKARRRRRRS